MIIISITNLTKKSDNLFSHQLVDHRLLEQDLFRHNITVECVSLCDVADRCHVSEDTNELSYTYPDGISRKVSVVYYRAGYTPLLS